jgi:hypothetical protein
MSILMFAASSAAVTSAFVVGDRAEAPGRLNKRKTKLPSTRPALYSQRRAMMKPQDFESK